MSNPKILVLILLLCIIACKEGNDKNNDNQKVSNFTSTNSTLNLSIDEMDKIMFCVIIVEESIKKADYKIEETMERLKLKIPNQLIDKITTEILEKCIKVDIKIANKYIKNLTYLYNFVWNKDFDKYAEIKYDKYNKTSDLLLTDQQNLLLHEYNEVYALFKNKREQENQKLENENKKIRIGNIEIENIPKSLKIGLFITIFFIFFGVITYYLTTLGGKPKDKKKKEKKKKIQ